MSEFFSTLMTFLPLLVIVLLANLAERMRERRTSARSPVDDIAESYKSAATKGYTPAYGSSPTYASATPWETTSRLPSSLTDMPDDDFVSVPATVQPTTAAAPVDSDGTIFAVLAYLMLGIFYALAAAAGMVILLSAGLATTSAEMPPELMQMLAGMNTGLLGWGLLLCSLLGVVLLLRPVRRLLAGVLPIDPYSTVHAVSLSFIMLVLIQTVFILGIGLDTMASMIDATAEQGGGSGAVSIFGAWFSALMMFLLGAVGVGWLVRRNTKQSMIRMGIVIPSVGQVFASILIGFLMVGVIFGMEWLSMMVGWGVDEDVARLTEQMLGGLMMTIPGVLTIGLAAGIGEEALMRGAVQPRLGLLLTSVIFALLHANYGITLSTLAVLIVGLVLGVVRNRFNTTSAMVVHATYNIIFGLIAYFSLSSF